MPAERLLPWLLRAGWVGVLAAGGPAIEAATADASAAVAATARWGGLAVWTVGVAAMAVPAVVSLTATRVVVPLGLVAAIAAIVAGGGSDAAIVVALAALCVVIAFSAELGRAFVQASAYGDEDRYPLRPPLAYALASAVTWAATAACVIFGSLLLAARSWVVGGVVSALAVAGAVWSWPRWHKLSRRWFVLVPVGIVVHDHVVLAETMMLRRNELAALRLAPADTGAADLTGPASGHAVEISTSEMVTVLLAATPSDRTGRPIHLTACLVSPSRPGRLLAAARARRLPVG